MGEVDGNPKYIVPRVEIQKISPEGNPEIVSKIAPEDLIRDGLLKLENYYFSTRQQALDQAFKLGEKEIERLLASD